MTTDKELSLIAREIWLGDLTKCVGWFHSNMAINTGNLENKITQVTVFIKRWFLTTNPTGTSEDSKHTNTVGRLYITHTETSKLYAVKL